MRDERDLLLAWLRLPDNSHNWRIRLFLAHGQTFGPSPLPANIAPMPPKCCYLNAHTLAVGDPDRFTYMEGFACTSGTGWGTPHAWCVDAGGRVVDPTWASISGEPGAYHGVSVPLDVAAPHAYPLSRGTFDWWEGEHRDDVEVALPPLLGLPPV